MSVNPGFVHILSTLRIAWLVGFTPVNLMV